jgi:hypothetical protein
MHIAVVQVPHHIYVEPVRMAGIREVKSGWIYILDADERMTGELAVEITKSVSNDQSPITNYRIPRRNIFARTKWLQYGGWYPDEQIRLMKREAVKDWPAKIHATPMIEGEQGILMHPFLHYFHGDLESMVNKTAVYEEIESELLLNAKRSVSTRVFFRKFFGELFRRLVKKGGWRDGTLGVVESMYQAYSKTVTYIFLYEKQKA